MANEKVSGGIMLRRDLSILAYGGHRTIEIRLTPEEAIAFANGLLSVALQHALHDGGVDLGAGHVADESMPCSH